MQYDLTVLNNKLPAINPTGITQWRITSNSK